MDCSKVLCDKSSDPANMYTRWFRMLVFLLLLVGVRSSYAATATINYQSVNGAGHLQSDLSPLGTYTFVELGAFTPGFEPTSLNRSSWLANWTPLHRVVYNATLRNFSGTANIESNTSPFTTTNKVWVWVYNRNGQWCLFSRTSWLWPNTSGPSPFPLSCNPAQANIVVAGSVSSSSPVMICQQVTDANGPTLSYTQWADFVLAEGQRGRTTDTDGDGQSNWYEYAFGSDPNNRLDVSTVVSISPYSGQPHLNAKIRRGWVTGVNYSVQWSDNLTSWNTTGLTTIVNGPTLWEVRDSNPVGFFGRRFMRVHITSTN